MDPQTVTLPIAFLAGLLSFASPCVLPLVPAYLGFLGGTAATSGADAESWREAMGTFVHALFFVVGFSAVFVLFGASATLVGQLLLESSLLLQRVGGVLLVVFGMRLVGTGWKRGAWPVAALVVAAVTFALDSGLVTQGRIELGEYASVWVLESVLMGLVVLAGAGWGTLLQVVLSAGAAVLNYLSSYDSFVPNFLASLLVALVCYFLSRADLFYAERRLEVGRDVQRGFGRSLLFGVVFAAGWTPCIGPILAAILVLAGQLQTVGQGILLLASYSLGLAIPFLIVGLAIGPLSRWLRRANRYLGAVSAVSGGLLVLMGILVFTDVLTILAQFGTFFEVP